MNELKLAGQVVVGNTFQVLIPLAPPDDQSSNEKRRDANNTEILPSNSSSVAPGLMISFVL